MGELVPPRKASAAPKKRMPRRSVLSDEIYDMIKNMIMGHEIEPGVRVNIDALAEQLDVSQTPIREALARLESDGLIAKEPLKGYRTTELLTMKELNDLFQFRILIEPWAAEQAAKKIDSTGKSALKTEMQIAKEALKFSAESQLQALTEHDSRFHVMISNYSGNGTVANFYERTHCHLHLFRLYIAGEKKVVQQNQGLDFIHDLFEQYYQSGSGQLAIKEHDAIAKAIINNDGKAAKKAMHDHIQSSLNRFAPAAQAAQR